MIQKAIKALISTKDYEKIVNDFAKEKYYQKFPIKINHYGFHVYNGYEILDNKTIKVLYSYGVGDYEYDSSFVVDITEEIREEKLKEIIK